MTKLQEQFEKDFPNKGEKIINASHMYYNWDFTSHRLDLREYKNLEKFFLICGDITSINVSECKKLDVLYLADNQLTSVDFLNQLPNPEKLEDLHINSNNIQTTDISIFSKFVNLKTLKIGSLKNDLKQSKHNQFYGSFKSWKTWKN